MLQIGFNATPQELLAQELLAQELLAQRSKTASIKFEFLGVIKDLGLTQYKGTSMSTFSRTAIKVYFAMVVTMGILIGFTSADKFMDSSDYDSDSLWAGDSSGYTNHWID